MTSPCPLSYRRAAACLFQLPFASAVASCPSLCYSTSSMLRLSPFSSPSSSFSSCCSSSSSSDSRRPTMRSFYSTLASSSPRRSSLLSSSSSSSCSIQRFVSLASPSSPPSPRFSSSSSSSSPPHRAFHSSSSTLGLDEFFRGAMIGSTGRSWRCEDLRLKSFDDLQKLWFVLLKERNMLHTYKKMSRSMGRSMMNEERFKKVQKSMAHIKMVLGERYIDLKLKTEPEGSTWRVARDKRLALKKKLSDAKRKVERAPRQFFRQKELHPQRKKIAFRHLSPRVEEGEKKKERREGEEGGEEGKKVAQ